MSALNRRDFLKLAGATAPAVLFPGVVSQLGDSLGQGNQSRPNIIILLFDAMSARNLSVYNYPRPTTPNLDRFAEHSTVYHSHYSGGNYTIPGVGSLLTGTYPWTHRAYNHSAVVKRSMVESNIFRAIGNSYHRLAFPQSVWANFIVSQFQSDIETILPAGSFGAVDYLFSQYFPKDRNIAARALDDFMFLMGEAPASLVFGSLQRTLYTREAAAFEKSDYPRGLPKNVNYAIQFRLDTIFDGLASLLPGLPSPFFTYLHLYPPHAPYRATDKFYGRFIDNYFPVVKPMHRFADGFSNSNVNTARRSYDEYVLSLDWELGKLMDTLEEAGILENSYVVITSDHGEMFERGDKAHTTVLLYDPVVHIPLLISTPGQKDHRDVFAPTNAVDLLPTLAHLAGQPSPSWSEGKLLPGLGGEEDMQRSTFVVEAKFSPAFRPFSKATIAMRKGNYKLLYYTGYEPEDTFELYDLDADIEELDDLYPTRPSFAKQLKEELLDSLFEANQPYMK